ncbi:hypothetical protein AGMMS50230_16700 [Spirochaetia bacterium]|nr:hypothetical protein AGMMS50230_16700 [Spirochaetia bacterium]
MLNPPKAKTKNERLKQQQEEKEQRRRENNSKKAKAFADQEFSGEKWKPVKGEERIFIASRKKTGKNSGFEGELKNAQLLRNLGSTVYFVPESRSEPGTKYDAIVNGVKFEFKNVGGNANTLEHQFLRSRGQAPNVFINLDTSSLTRREIMSTLYGARNKTETEKSHGYGYYNKFKGGRIILKIKGQENLVFLNVDDLKISGK